LAAASFIFDWSCAEARIWQKSPRAADSKKQKVGSRFELAPCNDFRLVKVIKVACKRQSFVQFVYTPCDRSPVNSFRSSEDKKYLLSLPRLGDKEPFITEFAYGPTYPANNKNLHFQSI
jgi:hypothetical protein